MTAHDNNSGMRGMTAEQVSTRVLYVLVGLIVAVFGAFFLIGYDIPYEENPEFNAPKLTDLVLVFIYLLTFAAAVLAGCAVVSGFRKRDRSQDVVNNIPAAKITLGCMALLVASLVVTFALGSTAPVMVNGVQYSDAFWLRATDMFINTSIIMLIVAIAGVVFGLSGYVRKMK